MITKHEHQISYICPVCNSVTTRTITPFVFSGRNAISIRCPNHGCETICVNIHDKKGAYTVEALCLICGGIHSRTIRKGEFWNTTLNSVKCDDSGINMMFMGEQDKIKSAWKKFESDYAALEISEEGFFDDFEPDTDDYELAENLCAAVELLSILSEIKEIHCKCGSNDVSFTVIDNKIGFKCSHCKSIKIIEPSEELLHLLSDSAPYIFNS